MKKTETFTFRVSKEIKEALGKEAAHYGCTPGQLTALLAERFVEIRKKCGDRVVYPPLFTVYPKDAFRNVIAEEDEGFVGNIDDLEAWLPGLLERDPSEIIPIKTFIENIEDNGYRAELNEKLKRVLGNNSATD